jgi:hypothetical protein
MDSEALGAGDSPFATADAPEQPADFESWLSSSSGSECEGGESGAESASTGSEDDAAAMLRGMEAMLAASAPPAPVSAAVPAASRASHAAPGDPTRDWRDEWRRSSADEAEAALTPIGAPDADVCTRSSMPAAEAQRSRGVDLEAPCAYDHWTPNCQVQIIAPTSHTVD